MANFIRFDTDLGDSLTPHSTEDLRGRLESLNETLRQTTRWGTEAADAMAALQPVFSAAAKPVARELTPAIGSLGDAFDAALDSAAGLFSTLTGKTAKGADRSAASVSKVGTAAKQTAAATDKAVRSLASFDELERLPAAAADTAAGTSSAGTGGSAATRPADEPAATQGLLDQLSAAWQGFWEGLQTLYAPAVTAWQGAWAQIRDAALAVWGPIQTSANALWVGALSPLLDYLTGTFLPGAVNSFSQAFAPIVGGTVSTAVTALTQVFQKLCVVATEMVNTVLRPALALVLTAWQEMMAGIQAGWAVYGQPLLDGISLAVQGICDLFVSLWHSAVQPVLQNLITLLDQLWTLHLKPLWDDLVACFGAVGVALLDLWNSVLIPALTWVSETFGPLFAGAFNIAAQGVAVAAGLIADLIDTLLIALRGLADFLSAAFRGQWDAAWNAMANTVAAVWQRIRWTVSDAVNGVLQLVNRLLSALGSVASRAAGGLSSLAASVFNRSAPRSVLPDMAAAAAVPVPALAAGAVIPPNRAFLALLGDQRSGTNVEAPLDTIKQALAETLAAFGGEGQPINIYLGEELLDTVIASSQNRRALRSGGR